MTTENIGEIVIAPRVLEVITGIAATKVEGVYALQNKNVTDSLSKTSLGRGVYLRTEEDGTVNADLYVSLQFLRQLACHKCKRNVLVPELLHQIQGQKAFEKHAHEGHDVNL